MRDASHRFDNDKRRRPDDHARQAMLTPSYILEPIRAALGGEIGLDPCTEPDNPTKADRHYFLPDDGCALPWDSNSIFCNPPYGSARDRWVARCIAAGLEGKRVALLVPSHTETRVSQRALHACTFAVLVRSRISFGVLRDNGRQWEASHGSTIFAFGDVYPAPLAHLGAVLTPKHFSGDDHA